MANTFIRLTPSQAMELKAIENIVGIDYDMGITSISIENLLQMVIDLKEKYEDTKEEYEEKIADIKEEIEEYYRFNNGYIFM